MAFTSIFTGAQIDARLGGNFAGVAITGLSFNSITGLATVAPPMNGTAAVGVSTTAARQDHVHASDTSKAALAGSSTQDFAVKALSASGAVSTTGIQLNGAYGGHANGIAFKAESGYAGIGIWSGSDLSINCGAGNETRVTVTQTGNVLIGTTINNGAKLQVDAGSGAEGMLVHSSHVSPNWLHFKAGSTSMGTLYRAGNDLALWSFANIALMPNGGSGNVLIGTTTAVTGAKLEVNGSASFAGVVTATNFYSTGHGFSIAALAGAASGGAIQVFDATSSNQVSILNNGNVIASVTSIGLAVTGVINASGAVTCGNVSCGNVAGSSASFAGTIVSGSTASTNVNYGGNQVWALNNGAPAPLYIQYSSTGNTIVNALGGNVLIGTTTSNGVDTLQVNGSAKINQVSIVGNRVEESSVNATSSLALNYAGYSGGFSQFRTTEIFNGKGGLIATFSSTGLAVTGVITGNTIYQKLSVTPAGAWSANTLFTQYEEANIARTYLCGNDAVSRGSWEIYTATSTGSPINVLAVSNTGLAVTGGISASGTITSGSGATSIANNTFVTVATLPVGAYRFVTFINGATADFSASAIVYIGSSSSRITADNTAYMFFGLSGTNQVQIKQIAGATYTINWTYQQIM